MVESPIEDGNESEGHIQSNEGTAVRAAGNRSPQMRKAIAQRNGSEGEVNGGGSLGNVEPKLPAFMFPEENQQGQSPYIQDQDIIDGTWLLYSLQLEETIHTVGGSDYQGQIQGLFCEIDLSAQKEDPSKGKSIAIQPIVLLKSSLALAISLHLPLSTSTILYQLCPWSQVWPGWKPCEPRFA